MGGLRSCAWSWSRDLRACANGVPRPNQQQMVWNPKEDLDKKSRLLKMVGPPFSMPGAQENCSSVLLSDHFSFSHAKSLLSSGAYSFQLYHFLTLSVFRYLSISWFLSNRHPCLRKPVSWMPVESSSVAIRDFSV